MSGGSGARTLRGRVHKENRADYGWQAAPRDLKNDPYARGAQPDEISRSGNLPYKKGASERVSKTGNGPSWATCGPAGSRPPRRYEGPTGGAS
jgi:hypothetical protein